MDDIDISVGSDLISNNKFIASSRWVADRFQDLIIGTPFELVLNFSLILGLSLLVIGRIR